MGSVKSSQFSVSKPVSISHDFVIRSCIITLKHFLHALLLVYNNSCRYGPPDSTISFHTPDHSIGINRLDLGNQWLYSFLRQARQLLSFPLPLCSTSKIQILTTWRQSYCIPKALSYQKNGYFSAFFFLLIFHSTVKMWQPIKNRGNFEHLLYYSMKARGRFAKSTSHFKAPY